LIPSSFRLPPPGQDAGGWADYFLVPTVDVMVPGVFGQDIPEMRLGEDQHMVERSRRGGPANRSTDELSRIVNHTESARLVPSRRHCCVAPFLRTPDNGGGWL
jgi:hypothetical protein